MIREKIFVATLPDSVYDKYDVLLNHDEDYDVSMSFEIEDGEYRVYSLDIYYSGISMEEEVITDAADELTEEEQVDLIEQALSSDEYLEE
jgi:hypothetical protein